MKQHLLYIRYRFVELTSCKVDVVLLFKIIACILTETPWHACLHCGDLHSSFPNI